VRKGDGVIGSITVAALAALIGVDGLVFNNTTNKPQANAIVSLVQPGESGMQTLGSVKSDAEGKFRIDKQAGGGGPALLQVIYQGVTYNQMLQPGVPSTNVTIGVFDITNVASVAPVTQHMILLQPSESQLSISETYLLENKSKTTYNDTANGTLQFYLPPATGGKAQVMISAPGGMPISRSPEKTRQPDIYKISYPAKPGETRFDISYTLPPAKAFSGKILHKEGATRLVTPAAVTLTGAGVEGLGQEPSTQARIYDVKVRDFNVAIEGTGSLRESGAAGDAQEDTGAPSIQAKKPRIYERFVWVLGLTFLILALGFLLLWRREKA
jgi:hypothetical protein